MDWTMSAGSFDEIDTDSEKTLIALEKEVDVVAARCNSERSYGKLRKLLSPVRQLPPEILSEIFVLLSETIGIPPRLMQTPWILGRVCSRWRTISRRDPRVWGHPIVNLGMPLMRYGGYPMIRIEDLECALDILPPVVNMDLYCSESDFDLGNLVPYLNRCRRIELHGSIESMNDICQRAPRNAFQNLSVFHFCLFSSSNDSDDSQGSASASVWGQLRSAAHLEELNLVMLDQVGSEHAIKSLMSLDIPHGQLKILKVLANVNIPTLCRFLRKCYSVTELAVDLRKSYRPSPEYDNYLYLPELRKLHVSGINLASWIPTFRGWQNIRSFTLSGIYPADRLQELLEQCASLECLRFTVPESFPLRRLTMPVLRFMDAKYINPAGPFSHFFVPALEYLRIAVVHNDFDFSTLSDMFEHSQCPLSEFEFDAWRFPVQTTPSFRNIFTLNSHTIDRVVISRTDLGPSIMREIGSGRLLPKVKDLVCYAESGQAILDMIEARILRKISDNGERTWRFSCYTSTPPDSPEANLLKALCHIHGIDVKIERSGSAILMTWLWVITSGLMDGLPESRELKYFPLEWPSK